uniref:Looped-hinge helix DNA binding domain-containing protein, AbrB family n=1 Tax=Candidatus Kentrum sp. TUN TaxID=2126343 RepID=A0A450ZBJ0_9GAMM|nr:MAG: looped-hinge helix DNA binding domain-containing protein, AbrB family [Candidatus Kentron sp. TUN]VFK51338.1 MAG: looped-hinge helix DNA binding domain-containing protein, AbrB family [Candidatus Kentron sp. TUN]VFK54459.1 MAG: looped-hinge helix DNA binding domain-containing protein, AbrB family [Candidatus Kentron sp. TUN]
MSAAVTLSTKNQIVIPKEARDRLHLVPGKRLLIKVEKNAIIIVPEPDDYVNALAGLHKEVWEGNDTEAYLREERNSWDDD